MTTIDSLLRPRPSRVLSSLRGDYRVQAEWSPGQRMEAAFALSLEARKLKTASMRAQGLSEEEMRAVFRIAHR